MERIIKTFIHNEDNGVYVLNVSDKISASTLRSIMNMLLQEEEKQNVSPSFQPQNTPTPQPPPVGGLENVSNQ